MQVRTSYSARSDGSAKRTPLVAITGTMKRRGQLAQDLVVPLLLAQEMPLQLDVHLRRAEDADDAIDEAADAESRAVDRGAAGERDQAADVAVEIVERERAFTFRRTQLHRPSPAGTDCGSRRATRSERAA